jgi:5-methylcytosine-specific restriction endonuclease McrA
VCDCGKELDKNARKGKCSSCYRKELYAEKDREFKDRRNAYLRARRAEGKGRPSPETQEKRNARQRERRRNNPEKQRAEKFARRSTLGEVDKDYVALLLKDPCSYCNGPGGTIDHIVPLADGGTNDWWNMTSACKSCNSSKGTNHLVQFFLRRTR